MNNAKKINIYEEGKIDIHKRKEQFYRTSNKLTNNNSMNQDNKKLILRFIRDCQLGKTIKGRSKKKIGYARCLKYIGILQRLSDYFNKSFDEISQDDMERFIINLDNDHYKSKSLKPYSDETKCDIKKGIKKFWKWKDGNNKVYPELVDWIETYITVKDVPALTRDEVSKIIEYSISPRDRALLIVLFDSGARIEELLNVRLKKEHIFWKDSIDCYMIRLEYSKTKPRTISLPLSTDFLKRWLEVHPGKGNSQAQLFPLEYANLRKIINRLGRKVLQKNVNPHLFRHSSATYYASRLNRYQLCYRYGWAMSSKQVDRYLDREGLFEEKTSELIKKEEVDKEVQESSKLKEEIAILKESHFALQQNFAEIQNRLKMVMDGRCTMPVISSVIKNKESQTKLLQDLYQKEFDVVLD